MQVGLYTAELWLPCACKLVQLAVATLQQVLLVNIMWTPAVLCVQECQLSRAVLDHGLAGNGTSLQLNCMCQGVNQR